LSDRRLSGSSILVAERWYRTGIGTRTRYRTIGKCTPLKTITPWPCLARQLVDGATLNLLGTRSHKAALGLTGTVIYPDVLVAAAIAYAGIGNAIVYAVLKRKRVRLSWWRVGMPLYLYGVSKSLWPQRMLTIFALSTNVALLFAVGILVCATLSGCVQRDSMVVWKAEAPSPDGRWVASADTVQNGGFGSASIDTTVYLKRAGASGDPHPVLTFHCHDAVRHPYVLDNVANGGGAIDLQMQWQSPTRLQVSYNGHADLTLATDHYKDIEVKKLNMSDASR
jgi:hypothetical protein